MLILVLISLVVYLLSLVSAIQILRYLYSVLGLDEVILLFLNLIVTECRIELASFLQLAIQSFAS